jgi:hypothetical protein
MGVEVILVHIGTNYPSYLNDCIEQLKKYKIKVHLIISDILLDKIKNEDIILSKVEDYINDDYNNFNIKGYDSNFRDGFWNSTTSRFFILNEYCNRNNINNFFHIENDNLIYDNLIEIKNKLSNIDKDMFVIIDSENRAIPSFIFIKDNYILKSFCDYLILNQHKNDMNNLFDFFISNNKVSNLPIIPSNYNKELFSLSGIYSSGRINYSNFYDILNCIFDGAAIGQYIGGVDPRNQIGDTKGFINETTIFNVSNNEYYFTDNGYYMYSNNNKIKIVNLHIHSKNLNLFRI